MLDKHAHILELSAATTEPTRLVAESKHTKPPTFPLNHIDRLTTIATPATDAAELAARALPWEMLTRKTAGRMTSAPTSIVRAAARGMPSQLLDGTGANLSVTPTAALLSMLPSMILLLVLPVDVVAQTQTTLFRSRVASRCADDASFCLDRYICVERANP